MAIKAGDFIGTFTPISGNSFPTEAVAFGSNPQLFLGQKVTVKGADGITRTGHVIRSRTFALSTAGQFTQAPGITDADVTAAFQESTSGDVGGFLPPAGFTTPDGYTKLFDVDGTPYYVKAGSASEDTSGDTLAERSASYFNQAWDWVKANPVAAVAIALAIAYLIHEYTQRNKKRKKKFLGVL